MLIYQLAQASPFLLAAVSDSSDQLPGFPPLVQYGLAGLILGLILTRQLVPGWAYSDVIRQRDEAYDQIKQMRNTAMETTIPALEHSTEANRRSTEALRDLAQLWLRVGRPPTWGPEDHQ